MLPAFLRYGEYGDVRVFYKNFINCFIFVILKNVGDISMKWDKVFKNGLRKICGRQPLKTLDFPSLPAQNHNSLKSH